MITGKIQIPEVRRATVTQALNQFSNLLNSKTFLINVSMKLVMGLHHDSANIYERASKVMKATQKLHAHLLWRANNMRNDQECHKNRICTTNETWWHIFSGTKNSDSTVEEDSEDAVKSPMCSNRTTETPPDTC